MGNSGNKWDFLQIHCVYVSEVKETSVLPMLSVDMENKENGSLDVKNSVENGRPPDPADWAVTDVVNYFRTAGFEEQAIAFQEQEIDGKSLLLMTRNDVLTGLSLKLGPALKIYEYHIKPLQTQHLKNNSL
ncbi:PREDICTED: sterile alpha motif domain-containing protein 13 isoform X2 [Crocodylus porosus]|uniref:Sterile alpha motif domain containing 13 n=2 Tax=Longirostres TaxID=1298654 RepID=A0A7M4FJC4_CROPO|nr:PREDICTED: sterile alpha motif domain-containing protein 13 isoform X2 [Gavialis gangeticus]XP_019386733.1 PREDICTED: sterile alpha motif domain-containing protein 13 isoform X2 [Crocodylus porosus]